ncbi:PHP domain-containing protein [Dendrosporobacter sp. 1207_IL3150]|uniref:PHP domain-containing protein n=1 Tax=Dendrosporobacter sp. 1207_IL3150 TaxID=3084054 RepID=UPI002FD90B78
MNKRITVEMHVHTCFSKDSLMSLQQLAAACKQKKIDCIAVTDHNTIRGAVAFRAAYPWIKVIIGEEISTAEGEIIGYFLAEEIEPGLSAKETIRKIKAQGGLVCVPHPFDKKRSGVLKHKALLENLSDIDIIEAFNGRNINHCSNIEAFRFAEEYGKLKSVGADAHTANELGRCQLRIDDFSGVQDFASKLKTADSTCKRLSVWKNVIYSGGEIIKRLAMPFVCWNCFSCTIRKYKLSYMHKGNIDFRCR